MSNTTTPMRVGAVMSADKHSVRLFGYGTYVGDEVPPPEVKMWGLPITRPNPKIVLDNGKVVWGCECWWGPEDEIKARFENRVIVEVVDIEVERAAANQQGAK